MCVFTQRLLIHHIVHVFCAIIICILYILCILCILCILYIGTYICFSVPIPPSQPVDAEAQKKEQAMKEFAEILAKAKEEAAKEEAAEKADEAVEAEVVPAGEEAPSDAGASTDVVVEAEASTVDEADSKDAGGEEVAEDGKVKPASLAKAEKAAASRAEGEEVAGKTMRSQKVVNLANEVDVRERTDIYRNFLLYCMSGDVVNLPMGSQVCICACVNAACIDKYI